MNKQANTNNENHVGNHFLNNRIRICEFCFRDNSMQPADPSTEIIRLSIANLADCQVFRFCIRNRATCFSKQRSFYE